MEGFVEDARKVNDSVGRERREVEEMIKDRRKGSIGSDKSDRK